MEELIITSENFSEYFRDVRMNQPQKGEVIARYTAMAEFIEGDMKKDVLDLLHQDKVGPALQVMQRLGSATEKDSIRLCKEICSDLASGMSYEEVENKAYKYQLEFFYYTKKDYIPVDDPHWSVISLKNLDEFLDSSGQKLKMTSKILDHNPLKDENEVR